MSELKAKQVSLISKIVAGVVLVVGAVLKWLGVFQNCEISDLCKVGFCIMAYFGTIDANIAIDKFTKKE